MKKILQLLFVISLLTLLLAPTTVGAATVKITKTKLTLNEGTSFTLKITGTTKTVKWTSSNKEIATVTAKGRVNAIKAGKATITATVSLKKYNCTVTVKEVFNANKAIDKLTVEAETIGYDVLALFNNNYSFPFELEATIVYYTADGDMISKSSNSVSYLEKGTKCAMYFIGPYDSDYNYVEYSDYEITYYVSPVSDSVISNVSDIKIEANIGADNVMAKVTNTGNKECSYTNIGVVFYKDGVVVGYSSLYAEVDNPKAVEYLEFYFPYDENYDSIKIDDYDIFVNYSYGYTW